MQKKHNVFIDYTHILDKILKWKVNMQNSRSLIYILVVIGVAAIGFLFIQKYVHEQKGLNDDVDTEHSVDTQKIPTKK